MRKRLPRHWLIAVSGGVDSLALAEFCRRWRRLLRVEIAVAHVHHGTLTSARQREFRDGAQALVQAWCAKHAIPFYTNESEALALRSENELREYRQRWLTKWRREGNFDGVFYAHHADDLLETRILRLIRGTGPEGLTAMRLQNGYRLRPFLGVSRKEIEVYARARGLEWCEDPSNAGSESLRNWVRRVWLPMLEMRQKGAVRTMARSLSLLARAPKSGIPTDTDAGLRRDSIKLASFSEGEKLVVDYLRALGFKNYAQTHVHEILKRIDTRRKRLRFEMLGVTFELTPDFLRASRV